MKEVLTRAIQRMQFETGINSGNYDPKVRPMDDAIVAVNVRVYMCISSFGSTYFDLSRKIV